MTNLTDELLARMRAKYQSYAAEKSIKSRSGIRFPSSIEFRGTLKEVVIRLVESEGINPVVSNMQTNGAAFEAWCIALKVWCDVERVRLEWNPPIDSKDRSHQRHYQRFLYRADCFQGLFGNWF